jgi:hypothetical protein
MTKRGNWTKGLTSDEPHHGKSKMMSKNDPSSFIFSHFIYSIYLPCINLEILC